MGYGYPDSAFQGSQRNEESVAVWPGWGTHVWPDATNHSNKPWRISEEMETKEWIVKRDGTVDSEE